MERAGRASRTTPKTGKEQRGSPGSGEGSARAEATFGPKRPKTASALSELGAIYMALGKYAEAEPFLKRSLAILEKTLGPIIPTQP
jgi:hypothetical protein